MGSKEALGKNPLQDFLITLIISGVDISDMSYKQSIENECKNYLEMCLINPKDVVFLDFEIKASKSNTHLKVVSNNILTALWFSGIVPANSLEILANNRHYYDGSVYKFNEKTKVLTVKKIV